ncbi:putative aspartic endopeptidase pep1 protein [Neofusicoccum parvum UCRNP2]|uniref:Putative aspartic endopeptidase pep1 protein n=1 Tax=Botryosphaeria parva (strain UCR-NP2) TaxID=1287680 RepID=R1E713_BOTPV|nr:putative aspartic endopeptidase pep1 protein [Neofusicoccum parvum UCRNP2]
MHSATVLLAALSAFSFSPVESRAIEGRQNKGFTLQQVVYGKRLKNGPIALGNLYKKVGVDMPTEVSEAFAVATESQVPANVNKRAVPAKPKPSSTTTTSSTPIPTSTKASSTSSTIKSSSVASSSSKASSTQSGSAVATPVNQFDTAYMIPITLGGTTVMVDLDTGSSDLWAFSNLQPSSQTAGHNVYSPNPANIMPGYNWNVTYLDGSAASGLVYKDTVGLGGMTFPNIPVEAAQSASSSFVTAAYDGMLGLAFDVLNTVRPVQQKTLFSNIMNQLPAKLFTSLLKHAAPGSYDFGYIDSSKYTGAITYATVDPSNGWWQFTSQGYSIGSGAAVQQSVPSVVDTGTTLMVMPSGIVSAYYAKVTNATYSTAYAAWIYPCTAALPNFNLLVNGAVTTVPGSLMTYGPIDYVGNCYGGLQQNDNIGIAILGDIFIKSQFIVYDQSTTPPRVGFAKQAGLSYTS